MKIPSYVCINASCAYAHVQTNAIDNPSIIDIMKLQEFVWNLETDTFYLEIHVRV